ncbi:MAG TPA: hypothetical protein VJT72_04035 [Pseudonocardiaceae bacterium]|nr:hypothetical protein [Pseudonocardiaceae bacterium]
MICAVLPGLECLGKVPSTAGLPVDADPQSGAVLHGLAASAYLTLGYAEHARAALKQSRTLFAEVAQPEAALPFFAFYGPGHGLLAATEAKLADYTLARSDVQRALGTRPHYDVRCRALDSIVLATILINSGELRDGISETRRALAGRCDSTCQDLARRVRALRVPTVNTATQRHLGSASAVRRFQLPAAAWSPQALGIQKSRWTWLHSVLGREGGPW